MIFITMAELRNVGAEFTQHYKPFSVVEVYQLLIFRIREPQILHIWYVSLIYLGNQILSGHLVKRVKGPESRNLRSQIQYRTRSAGFFLLSTQIYSLCPSFPHHSFLCIHLRFVVGEGVFPHHFYILLEMYGRTENCADHFQRLIQASAEKRDCFAKHQPGIAGCGMAGCGWLQLGRNFLST